MVGGKSPQEKEYVSTSPQSKIIPKVNDYQDESEYNSVKICFKIKKLQGVELFH